LIPRKKIATCLKFPYFCNDIPKPDQNEKILFYTFANILLSTAVFAQIPNNGFESWTNMGTYFNPDQWGTLNNTTAAGGVYTCTQERRAIRARFT